MKKIIISDFDDTIYINGVIDKKTVKLIHQFRKHGNLFIIASGSSYPSLIDKLKDSHLEYDYLICDHGCNIIKDNKLIFSEVIAPNIVKELVIYYQLDSKEKVFSVSRDKGVVNLNHGDISKLQIPFPKAGDDFQAMNYIKNKYGNQVNCYCIMHNNAVEIIPGEASKLKAVDKIIKIDRLEHHKIYTIGDGYSDIEMVKKYNGYCVENAVSDLKQISNKIYKCFPDFLSDIVTYKII